MCGLPQATWAPQAPTGIKADGLGVGVICVPVTGSDPWETEVRVVLMDIIMQQPRFNK